MEARPGRRVRLRRDGAVLARVLETVSWTLAGCTAMSAAKLDAYEPSSNVWAVTMASNLTTDLYPPPGFSGGGDGGGGDGGGDGGGGDGGGGNGGGDGGGGDGGG